MMSAPFSYSATVQVAVAVYQAQVPVWGYNGDHAHIITHSCHTVGSVYMRIVRIRISTKLSFKFHSYA